MTGMNILYILIVVLYCASVSGYFIDFIHKNQKVNRLAFWLLSIVWLMQIAFMALRYIAFERLPIMTSFEAMFFYSWILVTASLFINHRFRTDFLIFFLNLIGFIVVVIGLMVPTGDVSPVLSELFIFEMLMIHVVVLLLSYAVFTVSFVFSFLYFLKHHMLKSKSFNARMARTGNLNTLERYSFFAAVTGIPFMLIGLILGVIWSYLSFDMIPWLDPKVVTSFIVLAFYGSYVFFYQVRKARGYQLVLLNLAAFLILLINYFLSGSFSTFHIW